MKHTILNGDVIACLRSLPDACVQCVVTSPPYWGLRDYGVEGQIGLEPTPEEHVAKMVDVFREVRRVLRDDGVVWLNYGDCYYTGGRGSPDADANRIKDPNSMQASHSANAIGCAANRRDIKGMKPKDLVGMPWRIAFALQADGWYLRSDIIWSKPNPMPESVRDRPTRSHEFVFLLTKSPRYFYDADAVRERIGEPVRMAASFRCGGIYTNNRSFNNHGVKQNATHGGGALSYSGRNRRDVWTIATQATPDAHFATFPEKLVEPCIRAGTSERGACPKCGAPWRRVVERTFDTAGRDEIISRRNVKHDASRKDKENHNLSGIELARLTNRVETGWQPTCTCDVAETVPCVVLDPFAGSGTVSLVAHGLGRSSVGIELNEKYIDIIKNRWARGGLPAEALEVRAI